MNNYILKLLHFFYDYADELIENKIIENIKKKQISIDYLSNNKKGDIASNFFLIIKKKIINDNYNFEDHLKEKIKTLEFISNFEISKNNFINFNLKNKFVFESLKNIFENKIYDEINFGNKKNINIEFVSANPTGPIHIAHLRGAIFGDVLSTLYEKVGYNVCREYYVNDAGSQIDKLSNSLYKRYIELFNKEIEINDDEYPGEYLIEIAKDIYQKDNNKWLNQDKNKVILHFKDIAVRSLLNKIKSDLILLNINFDVFTHESDIVNSNKIDSLFEILKEKDLIYHGILPKPKGDDVEWEPREQLLFKSSQIYDDQDRAFQKSNGEWTYFANDAAYHYDKYLRKFDKIINIWGSDHIGYIPRMKSLMRSIQDDDNYFNVLICQIVSLIQNNKKIKMSKREGNFVTLFDLFNKVGKDPIRYYMISTRNETSIDFDLDNVIKKNKENNVFYCQYAYARASSVISKSEDLNINSENLIDYELFVENLTNEEWAIIKLMISYPFLIYQSAIYNEPHRLINYLENLCSSFHSIWNKGKDNESLRFIDNNNLKKTSVKLFWIQTFRNVLNDIFSIIDIDSPNKM